MFHLNYKVRYGISYNLHKFSFVQYSTVYYSTVYSYILVLGILYVSFELCSRMYRCKRNTMSITIRFMSTLISNYK